MSAACMQLLAVLLLLLVGCDEQRDVIARLSDLGDGGCVGDACSPCVGDGCSPCVGGGCSPCVGDGCSPCVGDGCSPCVGDGCSPCVGEGCPALDLEIWKPVGGSDQEVRLAGRITNHGPETVALERLTVRCWIDPGPSVLLEALTHDKNLAVYTAADAWKQNLGATAVQFAAVDPLLDCDGRRASQVVSITFSDRGVGIPAGGGYVQSSANENQLASWHRADWQPLDRDSDYTQLNDVGSSATDRIDLPEIALYFDDMLVAERKSATEADPRTGREPCP